MLSPQVRSAIYLITAVLSPAIVYLNQQAVISDFWMGLFSVVVTAVTGLAFSKVTPENK